MTHHPSVEEKIMEDIARGRVKLRSRFLFLAEQVGLQSATVLSIFLAVFVCMAFVFTLRATDSLVYLSFGSRGLFAFLESFPYGLVMAVILLLLCSGTLLRQRNISLRFPFGVLALGLVGGVVIAGAALGVSSIPEHLDTFSLRYGAPAFVSEPLLGRTVKTSKRGVVGEVIRVDGESILLSTPYADITARISSLDAATLPPLVPGMYVAILGRPSGTEFMVHRVRVVSPDRPAMIRRQIDERKNARAMFGEWAVSTPRMRRCVMHCVAELGATSTCGQVCGHVPAEEEVK